MGRTLRHCPPPSLGTGPANRGIFCKSSTAPQLILWPGQMKCTKAALSLTSFAGAMRFRSCRVRQSLKGLRLTMEVLVPLSDVR